ncbi:MAG: Do family serine endopeptidase [Planctomycetota bacterium]|jgi:serine protease Do
MQNHAKKHARWRCPELLGIGVLLAGLTVSAGLVANGGTSEVAPVPDDVVKSLKDQSLAFAAIDQATSAAVVSIRVERTASASSGSMRVPFEGESDPFNEDFLRQFFGGNVPRQFPFHQFGPGQQPHMQRRAVSGQGSGFIVSSDGTVITTHHVISDADQIVVRLNDDRELTATIVGSDPHTDVAVLHVDAEGLPTVQWGDSDQLQVGEWVLASGAPFGLTHTLTAGIVSATGRSSVGIADYEDFIQTDAAINPGNSGGPLLNLNGQVVGMNTAIFSKSGVYMGVGFAIPVNMVQHVSTQIIAHGSVTRSYLGVLIQPLTQELAESFGVSKTHGALVGAVQPGSPGERAGLKAGDIITAIEEKRFEDVGRLRNAIALLSPGQNVDVAIIRDGNEQRLTVMLAELPDADSPARTSTGPNAIAQ